MNSEPVVVEAHAKINLVLRVLERESNGYHQIETVFQRLALADTLTISLNSERRSLDARWHTGREIDLGPFEENLAWRAALAYCEATQWRVGWSIELSKRIPAGAGLGGGSSDAAAVLRTFESLSPSPVGPARLREIGASLGADVPFFVSDVPLAIGCGYGERLRALPALARASVVLLVPPYPVPTSEAYAALDLRREAGSASDRTPILDAENDLATWPALGTWQTNDFELPVFDWYPELGGIRQWLERQGASIARLTGSGSVVYGLWPDNGPPAPALDPPPGFRLIATTTG